MERYSLHDGKRIAKAAHIYSSPLTVVEPYKYLPHLYEKHHAGKNNLTDMLARETTIYNTATKTLVFVASNHHLNNHFKQSINDICALIKPTSMLLEAPKGISEKELSITVGLPETRWVASFAKKNNIRLAGIDLSNQSLFQVFLRMRSKDRTKLAIYWWIIVLYNNLKRNGNLTKTQCYISAKNKLIKMFTTPNADLYVFKENLLDACKRHDAKSLSESVDKIIQEMTDKYVKKGKSLDIIDSEKLYIPFPYSKKYRINKINTYIETRRNRSMLAAILNVLKSNDSIVVIAGNGHVMEVRELLKHDIERRFGKCSISRWYQIDSKENQVL